MFEFCADEVGAEGFGADDGVNFLRFGFWFYWIGMGWVFEREREREREEERGVCLAVKDQGLCLSDGELDGWSFELFSGSRQTTEMGMPLLIHETTYGWLRDWIL